VNLGELYVSVEQTEDAIESYQTAVRLNPADNRAQEVLSTLLAQTGDIEKVIETQENLVSSEPDNMKYRLDLAQSYHRAGQFENAIEQLTVVFEKEPDNIIASELLGDSYQQVERYQDAANVYNHILKSRSDDKKNMCNLSMCYTSLGRFTTAMRQVQQVIRMDRNYGLAYITRGMIYEASADRCVDNAGGKVTFNDKLVYKLAYDEYTRAKQDLEWKSEAERRIRYLETLIPTREDLFMNKDQTTPRGECYEWIR
jgi:tetratricopeptide (TPR) repeat protein